MPQVQAQRRLVKSPPELWTELSDAAALARHLGEFGEIRITRLEPESKVVWEGDRATGSVELNSAGWGTQVTLTVEVEGAELVEVEPEPGPSNEQQATSNEEPETIEPVAVIVEPEPEPEPEPWKPAAAPQPRRRGFFARLFARGDHVDHVIEAAREAIAEEPHEPTPVAVEPEPVEPEPEPVAVEPDPTPDNEQRATGNESPGTEHAVLEHMLDQLGQAHHRPFSRA